jgi:hypothetical protein
MPAALLGWIGLVELRAGSAKGASRGSTVLSADGPPPPGSTHWRCERAPVGQWRFAIEHRSGAALRAVSTGAQIAERQWPAAARSYLNGGVVACSVAVF